MGNERRMSTVSKISCKVAEVHQKTQQKLNGGLKYAIAWAAYVLIGSWVFIVLEKSTTEVIAEHEKWTRFKELMKYGTLVDEMSELRRHLINLCPNRVFTSTFDQLYSSLLKNETIKRDSILRENLIKGWITEVEVVCSTSLTVIDHVLQKPSWSMVDAIYYTMTLVTTIGFGHISPTTDIGKLFCIPYALVGVPLTCILMAKTSDMLSGKMLNFYESSKKRYQKHPKLLLAMVTWMFLIVGCFVFMFIPSLIFSILEEWTMIEAFYFTFITLSTIGFGDYIAGYGEPMSYSDIYKITIVIWIMIALGYWIFLLNFLQKAIKSNAKTLKKTFKTKNISKQAEFLKQMITKVTQQEEIDEDEDDYRQRLHMMALIVESLSGSHNDNKYTKSMTGNGVQYGRPGYSRANSIISKPVVSETQSTDKIDDEEIINPQEEPIEEPPSPPQYSLISFEDLMRVKVSVKTETLPGFETLVEQSASKECIFNDGQDDTSQKVIKEVTLPMRDVLSIVLFVASVDDSLKGSKKEVAAEVDDDTLSVVSFTSSIGAPIIDPRESLPLLKSILVTDPQSRMRLSSYDRTQIQSAYLQSTFSSYLDECGPDIIHKIEKQIEEEGDEELISLVKEKRDLEKVNAVV